MNKESSSNSFHLVLELLFSNLRSIKIVTFNKIIRASLHNTSFCSKQLAMNVQQNTNSTVQPWIEQAIGTCTARRPRKHGLSKRCASNKCFVFPCMYLQSTIHKSLMHRYQHYVHQNLETRQ